MKCGRIEFCSWGSGGYNSMGKVLFTPLIFISNLPLSILKIIKFYIKEQ